MGRPFHVGIFVLLLGAFTPKAQAALFDFSAFYFSDSFTNTETATYGRTFYDLCLATALNRRESIFIGWNYVGLSAVDNPGVAETLTSTQMGLKLFWFFGRDKLWRVAVAYNLTNTASYSDGGGNAVTWKGSGIVADLGASVPVSESWRFTLRLNYVSGTFSDQFIDTSYTPVSTNRSFIYPSLGLTAMF